MWNNPALNLLGWASAYAYPWSESIPTRSASILPSDLSASSPCMWKSRANPVDTRLPVRSSIHLTGRPRSSEAAVATT
jgi:hypothetical protein